MPSLTSRCPTRKARSKVSGTVLKKLPSSRLLKLKAIVKCSFRSSAFAKDSRDSISLHVFFMSNSLEYTSSNWPSDESNNQFSHTIQDAVPRSEKSQPNAALKRNR